MQFFQSNKLKNKNIDPKENSRDSYKVQSQNVKVGKLIKMMFSNSIICFVLLFVVYLTLSFELSNPNINKITFKPKKLILKDKLFCTKNDSYFYDYPDGDLFEISNSIESSQYNFLFLYADWDARSIYHSNLFLKLACDFYKEITFYSVNCFYGQCKTHFNLIKFPQILINIKNIGSFAYKNPLEYDYLAQYLKSILRPIRRIDSYEEFFSFISSQNVKLKKLSLNFLNLTIKAVLIGNFDFSKQKSVKSFKNFYVSSLNQIGLNNEYFIGYGLILNKTLLTQIQKLVKSNDDELMIFTKFGLQNSLRTINNIKPEKLNQWARDILLSISSPAKWFYPDINNSLNGKNKLLIFLNKENSNEYKINIPIINLFMMETPESSENLIRNDFFFKRYLDYLEFCFTKKQCKNSNFFTFYVQATYLLSKKTCFPQDDIDIFLVDINLYKNYAHNLLGNFTQKNDLFEFQKAIFVDFQNKIIYPVDKNLNTFIRNKFKHDSTTFFNKRLIKQKTIDLPNKKKGNLNKHFEINSEQLKDVINNHQFKEKDIIILYYNNQCGFCRLVNFQLLIMVNKYFKKCNSIAVLKIDTDLNDLDWNLSSDRVPMILFLPTTLSTSRESLVYNVGNEINEKKLLSFIINNTKNLNTIFYLLSLNEKSKLERKVSLKIKFIEEYLKKNKKNFESVNQSLTFDSNENIYANLRINFFEQIQVLKNII